MFFVLTRDGSLHLLREQGHREDLSKALITDLPKVCISLSISGQSSSVL